MVEYVDKRSGEVMEHKGVEFATILLNLSNGDSHRELTENLRELVQAVQDTGKPGTLTYTIKVKPNDLNANAVAVMDEIKLKKPEYDREKSLFFTDNHGKLTKNPPQSAFAFRANNERNRRINDIFRMKNEVLIESMCLTARTCVLPWIDPTRPRTSCSAFSSRLSRSASATAPKIPPSTAR